MSWVRVSPEQLFFSLKRELLGLVVLPCFDLCTVGLTVSMYVDTQLGVGCHWWFNYPGPLIDVELEFACLSC